MYTYGYPVSDSIYNDILLKYKNQADSKPLPTGMLLNANQPGYISSNNANMTLSRDKNTSRILGY